MGRRPRTTRSSRPSATPPPARWAPWAAEARIPIITWEPLPESIERLFATQLPVLTDILRGEMPADLLP
ncbi:MAG: hypothetical protein R3F11_06430 [Verrucomicrobiales bacterium]